MKKRFSHLATQLTFLPRTIRLVLHAARNWTLVWLFLLVIQGILPAAVVYLSGQLIDTLAAALGGGLTWDNIQPTLLLAGGMGILIVLSQLLQSVLSWVRTAQSLLIGDYLSALVHDKSTSVDLAFYEMPEYHDRLFRAQSDLRFRPLDLLESGGALVQNAVTLLAMGAILIPYGLWIPLVLVISTLPVFAILLRNNRRYHRWWERSTTDRRWADYYDMVLVNETLAPEVRLFNLGPYFKEAYQAIRQKLRREELDLIRRQRMIEMTAGLFAAISTALVMAWMVWRAFQGLVTLGDLALFYQAFNRGQSLLRSLLGSASQIYENILYLENLFDFLDLEPEIRDPAAPLPPPASLRSGIHFRNVTFRYPGSDRPVLENFNFDVPAGKVVAIVGANGAGKTTLMKLLCRFYDPEEGRIEFDGVDIRDFKVTDLHRLLTVMFQFPMLYTATAGENIALGDPYRKPNREEIETAAQRAGAHDFVTRLPDGYETLIGKLFATGTELSGGERQRLSLARAYLRRAQVMVLDEPTSFMDSWAEIDWFERLRSLANGRTSIVITHRFTIARHADVIYVMDKGQVVEAGSHAELLALNGRYAFSWQQQIEEEHLHPDSEPA